MKIIWESLDIVVDYKFGKLLVGVTRKWQRPDTVLVSENEIKSDWEKEKINKYLYHLKCATKNRNGLQII